ncbi:MAG: hypothetical protein JO210_10180, partial [Acidobacteriaceae bacterium]|nr:hypothetical protein [Acidobacteriaceae bacterium]
MFYQVALLAGYLYARVLIRCANGKMQAGIHIAVLTLSLLLLPIGPGEYWKLLSTENPSWLIFRMLAGAVGLPFIALSATSPLLQAWLANSGSEEPYRMFAVSNFASLAALLAYPTLIEPVFGTRKQSVAWSLLYVLFAMLCAAGAWQARNANRPSHIETTNIDPPALRKLLWF